MMNMTKAGKEILTALHENGYSVVTEVFYNHRRKQWLAWNSTSCVGAYMGHSKAEAMECIKNERVGMRKE